MDIYSALFGASFITLIVLFGITIVTLGIRLLLLWLPNFLERVKPTRKKRVAVHSFPFLRDRRKARFVNHDNRDHGPGYHDLRTSCNLRNGDWAKRSVDVE